MSINRRRFIQLAATNILLLSAGNVFAAFSPQDKLPARRKVRLRFAVISDGHYGQPGTDWKQTHTEMLNWINAENENRKLDFTFINGDLYHDNTAFAKEVHDHWSDLQMPWHVSHGNHDHGSETDWESLWDKPWNYSFDKGKTGFIVLNTADETGNYVCPDLTKAKALLDQSTQHLELFIFMHITPRKWSKAGIDCPELVEAFSKQQNLKAIFHGHDHDEDGSKEFGGKHYFFDSHIGGNWGTQYRGYRIVEVLKNGDVLTYQVNPVSQSEVNRNSIAS